MEKITNKEFSVTEISNIVRKLLEDEINIVRIRGEITGLKIATSGHCYFDLKDDLSVISCTCWRANMARVNFALKDGLEVSIYGKITAYGARSKYQISVDRIEEAGSGLLMQILLERKAKLAQEGLFDQSRKKPLPFLPNKVGIVTSLGGAVIQDIIHRIRDRFPLNVIIWPVLVQGDGAAQEIANAINGFNILPEELKPDLIIVARGGGSIEDLQAFNEEIVVRSGANSKIPLISAVGHETDNSLLDMAADYRAPTPTAAAEIAVPQLSALKENLRVHENIMLSNILQLIRYYDQSIQSAHKTLYYQLGGLNNIEQRLDELSIRLLEASKQFIKSRKIFIEQITCQRLSPLNKIEYFALISANVQEKLTSKTMERMKYAENALNLNSSLLSSLDHKNTLKRGFAIVRIIDDEAIDNTNNNQVKKRIASSLKEIDTNCKLELEFFDGRKKL